MSNLPVKIPQVIEGSYILHPIAAPKLPTYKTVKSLLWARLEADGWTMSLASLKVPHASLSYSASDIKRVWFKPQSIHVGFTTKLGDARTIYYDDIRTVTTDQLVSWIESR